MSDTDRIVRIVEVGPRDGLQNEAQTLLPEQRAQLVNLLWQAGLRHIEVGAFVSPRWVPQMANSDVVLQMLPRPAETTYSVLVPNEQGLTAALAAGADEVAVFASATESFSQRNINCSRQESLQRFAPVVTQARARGVAVRGYISCVMGCPYEGDVALGAVREMALALWELGCTEISLGDTLGVGRPNQVKALLAGCLQDIPQHALAVHFHDTWGMALPNCMTALDAGIRIFDSSVSGLGGCPYSPGATGNVASEDLVYLFEGLGLSTGVDLAALVHAGQYIDQLLGRATASHTARAWRHRYAA